MYLTVPTSKRKWWYFAETTYLFLGCVFLWSCWASSGCFDQHCTVCLWGLSAWSLTGTVSRWLTDWASRRETSLSRYNVNSTWSSQFSFFTAPNWLKISMLEKPAKSLQYVNMFVVWQIVPDSQPLQSLAVSSASHHFSSSRNQFVVLLMHFSPAVYIHLLPTPPSLWMKVLFSLQDAFCSCQMW